MSALPAAILITALKQRQVSVKRRDWSERPERLLFERSEFQIRDYKVTGVQTCALPICFAISTNKSTMIRFLALNGSRFPFNDVRMRQAVSLAIDRKDLVQALYLNYAEPTANLLNYTSPYYKDYPVEYDPEKARKLAREVLGGQRCEVV